MPTSEWKQTACILCECNCGIEVQLDGRRLAAIRGDKAHPASQGYTCNKALRLDHYQNGRHRLTSPLRRGPTGPSRRSTGTRRSPRSPSASRRSATSTAASRSSTTAAAGRATTSAAPTQGRCCARSGRATGRTRLRRRRRARSGSTPTSTAATRAVTSSTPRSRCSSARTRGSRRASRARGSTLKEIARDPQRSMIVIDPVRTETAELADFHLRVRPGTDAWCLAALAATLVQEGLLDSDFLAEHTTGSEAVVSELARVPVADYAARCGVDESLIRAAARRIGSAQSVAVFEDLGVQQAPNSVLCSYLNKLLWLLTGNFAKPGGVHVHSWLAPLARYRTDDVRTPVTGARIIGGLVPCNVIAEEILTDHPRRFRAMLVESSQPRPLARRLAALARGAGRARTRRGDRRRDDRDRTPGRLRAAGRQPVREVGGDVLQPRVPAQHLPPAPLRCSTRCRARCPSPRSTRGWCARSARSTSRRSRRCAPPRPRAAPSSLQRSGLRRRTTRGSCRLASYVLYETLGPTLPDDARAAAALWGLAHRCAMTYPDAVRRAGHADGEALFDAILAGRSGVVFTVDDYEDAWSYVPHPGQADRAGDPASCSRSSARSATHRTAGRPTSSRSCCRRASAAPRPRTRSSATPSGASVTPPARCASAPTTRAASASSRRPGAPDDDPRVSRDAGRGHRHDARPATSRCPTASASTTRAPTGEPVQTGVAPNELTSLEWRDAFAGTPWHKHVPARLEAVAS